MPTVKPKAWIWSELIGSGESIADPIRPLVADVLIRFNIPFTCIIYRLIEAVTLPLEELTSEVKAECENYAKRLGKALRWMSEDEFDSWLREKFGLPAPTLYTKIRYVAKPIKFFEVRSTPPKLVLRGNLGEQVVEYQGIRFKLIITKL